MLNHVRESTMGGSDRGEKEGQAGVAASLGQATEILLRAVNVLDNSSSHEERTGTSSRLTQQLSASQTNIAQVHTLPECRLSLRELH